MEQPKQKTLLLIKKIQSLSTDQIVQVEDFIDSLKERGKLQKASTIDKESLDFPVDDLGPWPKDLSLRREDMYDNDGR